MKALQKELERRGLWTSGMEAALRVGYCPVPGCIDVDAFVRSEAYTGPLYSEEFLTHVQAHILDRASRRAA